MISISSLALNFYEILGLTDSSCSANEIKKAYRKMSLRWYPDKNPTNYDEALQRFEKISAAYQILSTPETRDAYDRLRSSTSSPSSSSSPSSPVAPPVGGGGGGDGKESRNRLTEKEAEEELACRVRLKPAQQVFDEFFGGRNPFSASITFGSDELRNGRRNGCLETPTRQRYPCLDELKKVVATPSERVFDFAPLLEDSPDGQQAEQDQATTPVGPTNNPNVAKSCVRHVTTSTRISNGKRIITRKVVEDGVETVTVEENGKLVQKTVNGSEVSIDSTDFDSSESTRDSN